MRIDDHRDWGWMIVNHSYYRSIASEEQRREKTRVRVENFREKRMVTHGNASNAMQKQKQKQKQKQSTEAEALKKKKAFEIPTIEEVRLLAEKAGLPQTEADKFFYHYDSKGWKVGREPMKVLGSAIGGWAARWRAAGGVSQTYQSPKPTTLGNPDSNGIIPLSMSDT